MVVFNARVRERVLAELRRKYGTLAESVEQFVADQTADVVDPHDIKFGPERVERPDVREFFEGQGTHQTVLTPFGELDLQPADGRGGGIHGYVHLRPGTPEFTAKYIPEGEAEIEQIRLGKGEWIRVVPTSGKTGKRLHHKKVRPGVPRE